MVTQEINMLLPYFTLGALVAGLVVLQSRVVLSILLFAQIIFAYLYGIMTPTSLFTVAVFWGICTLHWRNLSSRNWLNILRALLIAVIAIGFASHLIPEFHNFRVFTGIQISSTSLPYTMYMNFDKTIVACIIALTGGLFLKQTNRFNLKMLRDTGIISVLSVSLLIPLALLCGFVAYEPKFPNSFWFWAFNNLYFVCFAEEVIFRGLIQTQFMAMANRWKLSPFIPILMSALFFTVALPGHLQGGPFYIAFVILSGLFYGYAYHHTKRLESAIAVHFFVNLVHFLFFSYPMLRP